MPNCLARSVARGKGAALAFAALDIASGDIRARHYSRRRRIEFLDFMNLMSTAVRNWLKTSGLKLQRGHTEAAVGIVSRFVLGKLRNRRFFSLSELNDAVRDCVEKINAKVMKQLKQSRNDLFARLDRPALKGLPSERYQYAEWKRCTVAPDYHVEVDEHYYSVPFALLRETVDARFTDGTIEIFRKGKRIASHVRSRVAHKHTTIPEHMPSSHRRYAEWSPARMLREAEKIGPATIALFEAIMKAKPHPEQGFRSCLGILSLVKSYGPERIEAAAKRGNDIRATTYGSIKSILQNGLDRAFGKPNTPDASPIRHANIRGRGYYH